MATKTGCFHKNERLAWFQWGMCIICTAYVHKRKTAVYLTAGGSAWLQVTRLLSQDGRRMFTLTLFTPVVGNLFHTTDGCQGEESIWMWLTARALFVCVRSHATIVELSIWVLSKICVMFQLATRISHWMQGKVTIITGSAQGLGKAFAIRLLGAGAKVPYLCYLKPLVIKKNVSRFLHCLFRFACPTSTPRWVRRPWWSSRRGLGRIRWPSSGALMA